ncbi:MAG TPA: DUF1844 domain-containing protein [Candidatus Cloacimonetes bacterium]|nr:DUF1844 domain-containing protein [Candidatus Cloacimonadota bacterium]
MGDIDIFRQIILSFHVQGMIALGKIEHPYKKEKDVNLEVAETALAMLRMIKEKTKGNLSEEEEKFLDDAIDQLQYDFMNERKKSEQNNNEK